MNRRLTLLAGGVVLAGGIGLAGLSAQPGPAAGGPAVTVYKSPT
jgi:hypothetical protein